MTSSAMPLFDAPRDERPRPGIPFRANEVRIYDLIAPHHGYKEAMPLDAIHRITGMSERTIKGIISELIITHGILIGASRHEPIGYFMIESDADRAVASEPLKAQIIQMLRRLKVINKPHQVREWLGQQAAELTGGSIDRVL